MNYNKIAKSAKKTIIKNGSPCYIKRVNEPVYNHDTHEYEGVDVVINGYAVQDSFAVENIDGTNIKTGDVRLMCVFDGVPLVDDSLFIGDNKYTVISIRKVQPDGVTVIYYDIQGR